jgi:hypothetical protein
MSVTGIKNESMEKQASFFEPLIERATEYGKTSVELYKLKAIEKTSQALREGQPKLRQQIVELGTGASGTSSALVDNSFPTGQMYQMSDNMVHQQNMMQQQMDQQQHQQNMVAMQQQGLMDSMSEMPPPPPAEGGDTSSPSGDESGESQDMGGEEGGKRSSYMAEVQKFAGKLGQELRDQQDKMESDDIKYVLNMIISAVDLDKLDFEDLEEIAKKFEREEEEGMGSEPSSEESAPEEKPAEEPSGEEELGEYDSMKALEEFIDSPVEADEIDLSTYADLGKVKEGEDDIKELDLDEIKNDINQAISERLSKYFN